MAIDHRAMTAAKNNADWYQTMFETLGLRYKKLPYSFVGLDGPLPYYSNLTVIQPGYVGEIVSELTQLADSIGPELVLKDSFCELSLAENGFVTLFEASWIWRAPSLPTMPDGWSVIGNPSRLRLWERSWNASGSPADRRLFSDALLDRDDTVFLGLEHPDRYIAGCIANMSDDCIGLSNVFFETPSARLFSEAADAVGSIASDRPIVGYERGRDLDFAISAGFETVGILRVLRANNAQFETPVQPGTE